MSYYNQLQSTQVCGAFRNSNAPNGGQLASGTFDGSVSVAGNLSVGGTITGGTVIPPNATTVNSTQTLPNTLSNESWVICTSATTSYTVTLPTPVSGMTLWFQNRNNGSTTTIASSMLWYENPIGTFNTGTSLNLLYESTAGVFSDGSAWYVFINNGLYSGLASQLAILAHFTYNSGTNTVQTNCNFGVTGTLNTTGATTSGGLLTASAGLTAAGTITLPNVSIANSALQSTVAITTNAITWSALQTFSNGITVSGGLVTLPNASIANSALQSTVAITTNAITWSALQTFSNGITVSGGLVTLPNASIADSALSSNIPLIDANNIFIGTLNKFAGGIFAFTIEANQGLTVDPGATVTLPNASIANSALQSTVAITSNAITWSALQTFSVGISVLSGSVTLPANSINVTAINSACISSGYCDATSSIQTQLNNGRIVNISLTATTTLTAAQCQGQTVIIECSSTSAMTVTFPAWTSLLSTQFVVINNNTGVVTIQCGASSYMYFPSILTGNPTISNATNYSLHNYQTLEFFIPNDTYTTAAVVTNSNYFICQVAGTYATVSTSGSLTTTTATGLNTQSGDFFWMLNGNTGAVTSTLGSWTAASTKYYFYNTSTYSWTIDTLSSSYQILAKSTTTTGYTSVTTFTIPPNGSAVLLIPTTGNNAMLVMNSVELANVYAANTFNQLQTMTNGLTVSGGTVTFPNTSIANSALQSTVGITSNAQTWSALQTFSNGITVSAGNATFGGSSLTVNTTTMATSAGTGVTVNGPLTTNGVINIDGSSDVNFTGGTVYFQMTSQDVDFSNTGNVYFNSPTNVEFNNGLTVATGGTSINGSQLLTSSTTPATFNGTVTCANTFQVEQGINVATYPLYTSPAGGVIRAAGVILWGGSSFSWSGTPYNVNTTNSYLGYNSSASLTNEGSHWIVLNNTTGIMGSVVALVYSQYTGTGGQTCYAVWAPTGTSSFAHQPQVLIQTYDGGSGPSKTAASCQFFVC
jgi:hypothetical protein